LIKIPSMLRDIDRFTKSEMNGIRRERVPIGRAEWAIIQASGCVQASQHGYPYPFRQTWQTGRLALSATRYSVCYPLSLSVPAGSKVA
jgi:hypothetical protein